jgi:hypothetical protein
MGFEVQGKVVKKFEAQQVTERFRKREFVLEIDDGRYPQTVLFQLTGNRCEALDPINEGDAVGVEFSLRGREWTSPKGEVKYFNSLEVWKVERAGAGQNPDEPPPPDEPPGFIDPDQMPF